MHCPTSEPYRLSRNTVYEDYPIGIGICVVVKILIVTPVITMSLGIR